MRCAMARWHSRGRLPKLFCAAFFILGVKNGGNVRKSTQRVAPVREWPLFQWTATKVGVLRVHAAHPGACTEPIPPISSRAALKMKKIFEEEVKKLNAVTKKMSKLQEPRASYMTQLAENESVIKELGLLDEEDNVFKMMGPVLVKQELDVAKRDVNNRISFFKKQLYVARCDTPESCCAAFSAILCSPCARKTFS